VYFVKCCDLFICSPGKKEAEEGAEDPKSLCISLIPISLAFAHLSFQGKGKGKKGGERRFLQSAAPGGFQYLVASSPSAPLFKKKEGKKGEKKKRTKERPTLAASRCALFSSLHSHSSERKEGEGGDKGESTLERRTSSTSFSYSFIT